MNLKDVLVLDTEVTTYEMGNPFSKPNRLMCVGTLYNGTLTYHDIEHSGAPYSGSLRALRVLLSEAKVIVGFNLKYDLHWLRKYLPEVVFPPVYDVQYGEFILNHQLTSYPSLDDTLSRYGSPLKLDVVKTEYWDKGLDTSDVPVEILKEYVLGDVDRTYQCYLKQLEVMPEFKKSLMWLHCQDLLTLQEAEYNGMLFDEATCQRLGEAATQEIFAVQEQLTQLVPLPFINWGSTYHVSAILFGGGINYEGKETVQKTLKSGRIKTIERKAWLVHEFPRLVDPLPNTELSDTVTYTNAVLADLNKIRRATRKTVLHRCYSTSEENLRSLPAHDKASPIIDSLLTLAKLDKLNGTYYQGIPKLVHKMAWETGTIHGQFNQCVAITGRLSSSKPNLQNFDGDLKPLFYSRFT